MALLAALLSAVAVRGQLAVLELNYCACVQSDLSSACASAGADTIRVYADNVGASTATFVFAAPATSPNVLYARLPVPPCVDAGEVTATDCNGDAIAVQVNATAGGACTSVAFGAPFQAFVSLPIDPAACAGRLVSVTVSMPGAGLNVGDSTPLMIGASNGMAQDCTRCDAPGASFTCGGAEILTTCDLVCATHTGFGCIQTPTCSSNTGLCTSGQYANQNCTSDAECGCTCPKPTNSITDDICVPAPTPAHPTPEPPTATPTPNPTATPTANPTATPTANPTPNPTFPPTPPPTPSPTENRCLASDLEGSCAAQDGFCISASSEFACPTNYSGFDGVCDGQSNCTGSCGCECCVPCASTVCDFAGGECRDYGSCLPVTHPFFAGKRADAHDGTDHRCTGMPSSVCTTDNVSATATVVARLIRAGLQMRVRISGQRPPDQVQH